MSSPLIPVIPPACAFVTFRSRVTFPVVSVLSMTLLLAFPWFHTPSQAGVAGSKPAAFNTVPEIRIGAKVRNSTISDFNNTTPRYIEAGMSKVRF